MALQDHEKHEKITPSVNKKGSVRDIPGLSTPFFKFIIKDKTCLRFLIASAVITIIYFILLRIFFLGDSAWWDSIQYIEAAAGGLEVSTRPTGYSNFISFFHAISHSTGILILAQYIINIIANLFLFFTLLYFFSIKKGYGVLLFIFLIGNPLYALYSNYILSDALFCSLSVIWFTVLLWIMCRPRWVYFFIQLVLLYWLFLIRYNALVYPFVVAVAYLLSKQAAWKKIISIAITFLVLIELVNSIIHITKEKTGIATFSALGGWQLANNSIFVLKHVKPDSSAFTSKTSKEIYGYVRQYYDSKNRIDTIAKYEDTDINAQFIWNYCSPLPLYESYYFPKFYAQHPPDNTGNRYTIFNRHLTSWDASGAKYMLVKKQPLYFLSAYTTMGPVFGEFGTEVIKKYPLDYFRYFIWPNIKLYFQPPMEAYINYNHYIPFKPLLTTYYNFTPGDLDQANEEWITLFMYPWGRIFTFINILFLLLVAAYYFTRGYTNDAWFNRCLIFYLFFYALNFFFSILVAPINFRYHVTIVTLCITFIVYLWQRVFNTKKIELSTL